MMIMGYTVYHLIKHGLWTHKLSQYMYSNLKAIYRMGNELHGPSK